MAQTHLVGSMNLDDAETVFRTVAETLGDSVMRIPDGETGPRAGWIFSMIKRLHATPGLEQTASFHTAYAEIPQFGLRPGVAPQDVGFELGYNEEGIAAWPTFAKLKAEDVLGGSTKYQIAIPTAIAVAGNFIRPEDRPALFGEYEARLAKEIADIAQQLPNDEIAIQWDVAVEFGLMEGAFGPLPLPKEAIIEEIVRMSSYVPAQIEMGYHLCYGDAPPDAGAKGRHFVEPNDTALLVEVANAIASRAQRPISWIHMPVPMARDDDAYFAPLDSLELRPETQLYLGLVHEEDGREGTQRRIAAAANHVKGFGVATECGMSNEPRDKIREILHVHREARVPA